MVTGNLFQICHRFTIDILVTKYKFVSNFTFVTKIWCQIVAILSPKVYNKLTTNVGHHQFSVMNRHRSANNQWQSTTKICHLNLLVANCYCFDTSSICRESFCNQNFWLAIWWHQNNPFKSQKIPVGEDFFH